MSGVIPRNLKEKRRLNLKALFWRQQTPRTHTARHTDRQTHTHTHDDRIRRNTMRCISPKTAFQIEMFSHFKEADYR